MRAARRDRSRTLKALAALTLLAALATACGDEADDAGEATDPGPTSTSTDAGPSPRGLGARELENAEAELALLTQANLGAMFEPDEVDEPAPDDGQTGCASDVAFDDRLDRERIGAADAEVEWVMFDDVRILVVSSHVVSFAEESAAEDAFERFAEDMGGCTLIEESDEDGAVSVTFEIDDDTATSDVDEQFNMVGSGTGTWGDSTFPMAASFSVARLGNNATMVFLVSLGSAEDRLLIEPYTEIAVNRLVAVDAGETPSDDTAPAPGTGMRLPRDLSGSLQEEGQLGPESLLGLAAVD